MILVTGGTGLVGRHLLLELSIQDAGLRAIYRSQDKVNEVVKFFAYAKADDRFPKIEWIQADLTDISQLSTAFERVTQVYHCAGLISFDPYQARNLRKTNVEGTANIVNLCMSNKVSKLCYLSSIATLSKLPNNPINEDNHWDPNAQNSVYGISKYGAEMEAWRGTQEGLDVTIFNPGVILGEGDYTKGSGQLFSRILQGMVYCPKGSTAFVDVKDVVHLMIQGMQENFGQKRYIVAGNNASYAKILSSIAQNLGVKIPRKKLSKFILHLTVKMDVISGIFSRKRKLTKAVALSITESTLYDQTRCEATFNYKATPLDETIARVTKHFKTLQ